MMKNKAVMTVTILVSIAVLISSMSFAYFLLFPFKVLDNWTLSIPESSYQLGDSVPLTSKYTKTLQVTGVATRYIECNTVTGVPIRYEINSAKANRNKGTQGTGIVMKIPNDIPEVTLPTDCVFTIILDYKLNSLRTITESMSTKPFKLYRVLPVNN